MTNEVTEPPEIDDKNLMTEHIHQYSIAKRVISIVAGFIPLLTMPFLYLIGRTYDLTYYSQLGIPSGILSSEMSDTLLTGFLYGIVIFFPAISDFILGAAPYLFGAIFLWQVIIHIPKLHAKIFSTLFSAFKKVVLYFGKDKSLEYLETVEKNTLNDSLMPQLMRILEIFLINLFLILIILYPAKNTYDKAKENAINFITNTNKTDCRKSYIKECQQFATIMVKPAKKLEGFIVTSAAKEWAIYQPPYLTKEKLGKMIIIKRQAIVEVHHPIQLSGLAGSVKE